MANLYEQKKGGKRSYHRCGGDRAKIAKSTTVYVGNLSFYTTEEQIYSLFSRCGDIKRIVMGLDRFKKTPCGFCFVEFYKRESTDYSVKYVNQTKLDDRIIRIDWDVGFEESRQYGQGKFGGQVRDEYREGYDAGRGGYGKRYLGRPSAPETATEPTRDDNKHDSTSHFKRKNDYNEEEEVSTSSLNDSENRKRQRTTNQDDQDEIQYTGIYTQPLEL